MCVGDALLEELPYTSKFRGAQFSRIAISKHLAETIFADQEFRVYGIQKFRQPNFRGLLYTIRENSENYGPRKFGHIRYSAVVLVYCKSGCSMGLRPRANLNNTCIYHFRS